MASSGVNFYLNNFASFNPEEHFKVYYSFKQPNVTGSISGGLPIYTGKASVPALMFPDNDYLKITGASFNLQILNASGLWSDEFTMLFLVNRPDSGRKILFDCLETGFLDNQAVYKGFYIGYNDAGNVYFEYYGQNGYETSTTSFIPYENHSIYLTKNSDSVTIGQYDFFQQNIVNQSFNINSSFLFESTGWFLGKGANLPRKSNMDSGKLWVDEFLYFDRALYEFDIRLINSGFISYKQDDFYTSQNIITTGITGQITGATGILYGQTGWSISGSGVVTDDFGNTYTGYFSQTLSGLSGSGIILLTGLVTGVETIFNEGVVIVETGLLRGFYPREITYVRKIDSTDITEASYETGFINGLDYINYGIFDSAQNKFKIFANEPVGLFLNGIDQISGNLINTGTLYNPAYVISGDYFRTGSYLDTNNFYSGTDNVWYQMILKNLLVVTDFSHVSGNGVESIGTDIDNTDWVFFNGQRLIRGNSGEVYSGFANYYVNSNAITFNGGQDLYQGALGTLSALRPTGQKVDITGHFTNTSYTGFNPYHTSVFLNGQIQVVLEDYLVTSRTSRINRSGVFTTRSNIIYNNINETGDNFLE